MLDYESFRKKLSKYITVTMVDFKDSWSSGIHGSIYYLGPTNY